MKIKSRKLPVLLLLLLLSSSVFSQENDKQWEVWGKLTSIDWEYKYSEMYKTEIGFPKFNKEVKDLDGKEVTIKGYVIPLETEDNSIIISSLPYSSCFFCGGGGVETVMAVFPDEQRKYELETVTFKGVLELNNGETGLIYNLKNAFEVEE
ncbi:hypothetical protein R9C00_13705 [Flammeovirgaceae bacterium SG7u.111]|nr:hypothetical protein [Flammeovirgaceae bacterium SG7u.132]WPO38510.1 hypothetical protein R9C00_13705 [Flammeovirgaceae bacterium SG7u.111]